MVQNILFFLISFFIHVVINQFDECVFWHNMYMVNIIAGNVYTYLLWLRKIYQKPAAVIRSATCVECHKFYPLTGSKMLDYSTFIKNEFTNCFMDCVNHSTMKIMILGNTNIKSNVSLVILFQTQRVYTLK